MGEDFTKLLSNKVAEFEKWIMHNLMLYHDIYHDKEKQNGFPFLEITSEAYNIQEYYKKRLESYVRDNLINDVLSHVTQWKGKEVYFSEPVTDPKGHILLCSNQEYEKEKYYEALEYFDNECVIFRYSEIDFHTVEEIIAKNPDLNIHCIYIVDWGNNVLCLSHDNFNKSLNGIKVFHIGYYEYLRRFLSEDEYVDYIVLQT